MTNYNWVPSHYSYIKDHLNLFQGILDAICYLFRNGQSFDTHQSPQRKNLQLPGNCGNCTNAGPALETTQICLNPKNFDKSSFLKKDLNLPQQFLTRFFLIPQYAAKYPWKSTK